MSFFEANTKKSSIDIIKEVLPTIYISKDALIKMKLYIDKCSDEIGWLGTVSQNENDFLIEDVLLFDQEVHSTTTEITPEGLSSFAEEILKEENGVDLWNSIKMWGHSHVNMGVSPSGQDDSQMVTFKDSGHDWFIRVIANKKGDMKVDLYRYDLGVAYKDLPFIELLTTDEYEIKKEIIELQNKLDELSKTNVEKLVPEVQKDIEDKVKKKVYGVATVVNKNNVYSSTVYDEYKKKLIEEEKTRKERKEKDDDFFDDEYFGNYGGYYNGYYDTYLENPITKELSEDEKMSAHKENVELGLGQDWFMEGIAVCDDENEVRDELAIWGYTDVYNDEEIESLWHEAIKRFGKVVE